MKRSLTVEHLSLKQAYLGSNPSASAITFYYNILKGATLKHSAWLLEAAIYIGLVALGALLYTAFIKYGIPWYYCHYYSVCLY